MTEYIFTLRYQLTHDQDMDGLLERLGASGCDDAIVGVGQPGRLALEFAREAGSAQDAVHSALADVQRAVPQAHLVEVTPDLVGLTDVAEVVGVSRQNMRKLMLVHYLSFPAPVHEGNPSIWHLAEVLSWMQARQTYSFAQEIVDVAKVAMRLNVVRAHERIMVKAPSHLIS
ncbi:putative DNA-binding transcriptional regulator AlpA [Pseudomonas sp. BIGb0278]|nr:putative DNA-binding transcriptional regulator AlpA [Pseudomonas sp. BIGb0278]